MEQESERKERVYFNTITTLNQISSLIAFLPPLFAVLVGMALIDYFALLGVQIVFLFVISSYKYQVERKYREIEVRYVSYVLRNTFSYAVISIGLPIAIFLIDLFYSLSPAVRVATINVLFVFGLFILLSNLPAARLIRISKPLDDQFLVDQATNLSSKLGTGNLQIYVMDLDKFKIANAAQIGARKFSVFVSSYLLKNLTPEENVAVIAHEFAHARERHVLKTVIIVWILTVIAGNMMLLPIDTVVYPLLSFVLPMIGFAIIALSGVYVVPAIQRYFETQADLLATEIYDSEKLVSALEKINKLNLTPRDLSRHWNLDHPSTMDRIKKIRKHARKT